MEMISLVAAAHGRFKRWRSEKAYVLTTVGEFPPKHPLRIAACSALAGDPLSACTLVADDAAARLHETIGDETFGQRFGGLACTHLFYPGARADALGMQAPPLHMQWLRLKDLERIIELEQHARAFANSARALTRLPREMANINRSEARFLASWGRALRALLHDGVDLRGGFAMAAVLHSAQLPDPIRRLILEFAMPWPQFAGAGLNKRARPCA